MPTVHADPFHAILLPRLLLVADGFVSGRAGQQPEVVRARVLEAVAAGVAWVQLRDYAADEADFADQAPRFAEALRAAQPSLMLSVNRRLDVAAAIGAGLHVGRRGPSVERARARLGPFVPVGTSAHSPDEAREAADAGADYVFLGPIYSTTTHPERAPLGVEALSEGGLGKIKIPVYAIGGVTPARAAEVHAAGAYGTAVLGGLLDAPDYAGTIRAYLRGVMPPRA